MTLAPGTRLGPYEISAKLGEGGMGEVYRATDTRLGREVAIKVLPESVAQDPERLARFEREARAASTLNHPNIMTVHDVGVEAGKAYLVTELLDGESLQDLMGRGALPERKAIDLCTQLARGLAAAHAKGIVHRDLKPGNIFITRSGVVKILDFGLARMERPGTEEGGAGESATELETVAGSVLGTPGYMAPEQVLGQRADARSDLFSFGAILYELLTGEGPFRRDTAIDSLGAILHFDPPDLSSMSGVSAGLARIVDRLLEKAPEQRFQTAADLGFALDAVQPTSVRGGHVLLPQFSRISRIGRLLVGAALGALGVIAAVSFWPGHGGVESSIGTVRFTLLPPAGAGFLDTVESTSWAISPDGRKVAFVASSESGPLRVWLRRLDQDDATPMEGTEDARSVFWSPDGTSLAFFTRSELKRVDSSGGAPVPICAVPAGIGYAGSWGDEDDILYAPVQGYAIYRVPASGGEPAKVVERNIEAGDARVAWPRHLPGSRDFLYLRRSTPGEWDLMVQSEGGRPQRVAPLASRVEWVGDRLLYVDRGALLARRFDIDRRAFVGPAVAVAPRVNYFYSSAAASFAASRSGTIVYQSAESETRLEQFDRRGSHIENLGESFAGLNLSLSSDGERVLYDRKQPELGTYDVWSYDLTRGIESRLTTSPDAEFNPIWFPDGREFLYSTIHGANPNIVRRRLGETNGHLVHPEDAFQSAASISPDGRTLVYAERRERGGFQLWMLDLEADLAPVRLSPGGETASSGRTSTVAELAGRISPDGKYFALISWLSGTPEVYLAALSSPAERTRISRAGARLLRWSRSSSEICYLTPNQEMIAVSVRTAPTVEVGPGRTLFTLPQGMEWLDFDTDPEARRFLALVQEKDGSKQPATVIVNWRPGDESRLQQGGDRA